jgi:hypothetical protein
MGDANSQENYVYHMARFVKNHQLPIGLLLVFFGIADLWFVMPNMYAGLQGDWHVDWRFFYFYMPEWSFTVPALLLMSLLGTVMLCVYCIRENQQQSTNNKEYAAIVVAALGFTYQVIGAWPFWNQLYPWPWQAEIAKYGNLLVLPLFIGSLSVLVIGAASLYIHSKILHAEEPEISND